VNASLPVHYLPSVQYFSKFLLYDKIILDDKEGFERQTYRNRCYIAGANGKLPLIIPIQNRGNGQLTKNVKIDNTNNWQRIHWQSVRSAYGKAPFFEYYADHFLPMFTTRFELLFSFDLELLKLLKKLIGIEELKIVLASETDPAENLIPAGEFIHPKKDFTGDKTFHPARYLQAFEERLGFLPNLSIIDALFNLGPGTTEYLGKCLDLANPLTQ
jgi:hypothetical protein